MAATSFQAEGSTSKEPPPALEWSRDGAARMRPVTADLSPIFKAYDIRGVYPDELDEAAARRIGHAFATWADSPRIVLGRDMRTSSPALSRAFIEGAGAAGVG